MITIEQIWPLLNRPKNGASNQVLATCPFCNKEGHFYLNRSTFLWICHKCQERGNLFGLLKQLDALHLLEGVPIEMEQLKPLIGLGVAPAEQTLQAVPDVRLPTGFTKLYWDDRTPYTKYLKGRKYTREDFLLYQPGYTNLLQRYEGFVIIPVYHGWTAKGFVSRSIYSKEYLNEQGSKFSFLLDGIDECTMNTTHLIVTEGHFDRVSVANELGLRTQEAWGVVASFGKKLSRQQVQLIDSTNVTHLYFMYDARDAVNAMKQYGNMFKHRQQVYGCWNAGIKDPGEMGQQEILQVLQGGEPIGNFTYNYVQANALR